MKNNNKGFTLIEVICSVALLAIIITASASFFKSVAISQRGNKDQLYANNIAQEVMEEVIRTGDLAKDYTASYGKGEYTIEVTSKPNAATIGGNGRDLNGDGVVDQKDRDLAATMYPDRPTTTKIPITYEATNVPIVGTTKTPDDDPWNDGRPDKYTINLDTSDYLEDDLYALYYAGLELEKSISFRTPSSEAMKRSSPTAVYNYQDEDLMADVKKIDFSFLPPSIGNNSFANKSFAFYRYMTKNQIVLLYTHFKEQIDNFYISQISANIYNCPNDKIKNYWLSFANDYTKNQFSALKDWYNISCDILAQYGVDRKGATSSYQYGNSHVLTSADITANRTYTPVYADYMDTAEYFKGLTVSELFILKQNFLQPIYQQISRSDIAEPIPNDPETYGHGPFYIYKVLTLDEDLRRADEKAGLNTSLIDYTTLDRMVYVSRYTQDSLDITFQLTQNRFQITGLSTNKELYNNNNRINNMCYYWDADKWGNAGQNPDEFLDLPCIYLMYETVVDNIRYYLHPKNVIVYVSGCFTYADDIRFLTEVHQDMTYTNQANKTIMPNIDLYKDYIHTDADFIFNIGGPYADSIKLDDTYDKQNTQDINGGGGGPGGGNGGSIETDHGVQREKVTLWLELNVDQTDLYTVRVKDKKGKVVSELICDGNQALFKAV